MHKKSFIKMKLIYIMMLYNTDQDQILSKMPYYRLRRFFYAKHDAINRIFVSGF